MNYLAILVGAIAYMVIGALWYSPLLLGKAWERGLGKTAEQIKADSTRLNYLWAFILAFIVSYGIARVSFWANADSVAVTVKISLLAAICFVVTTMGVNDIFESRPRGFTIINILYHVVSFIVIGVIIGIWR